MSHYWGNVVTLLVAIGGWLFAYKLNKQSKRIVRLEKNNLRMRLEVRARMAVETAACEMLSELRGTTPLAIQRELRDKTHTQTGLRPKLTPRDVAEDTPPDA